MPSDAESTSSRPAPTPRALGPALSHAARGGYSRDTFLPGSASPHLRALMAAGAPARISGLDAGDAAAAPAEDVVASHAERDAAAGTRAAERAFERAAADRAAAAARAALSGGAAREEDAEAAAALLRLSVVDDDAAARRAAPRAPLSAEDKPYISGSGSAVLRHVLGACHGRRLARVEAANRVVDTSLISRLREQRAARAALVVDIGAIVYLVRYRIARPPPLPPDLYGQFLPNFNQSSMIPLCIELSYDFA